MEQRAPFCVTLNVAKYPFAKGFLIRKQLNQAGGLEGSPVFGSPCP
ncbi:hypothetical protein CLOSTMETH_01953 [[Clostridium] methylpentosum DSM 5476]|uniref:Uncharacterized protein n=1 Tax=[Clostridium] methylpentosum DSM 5476 TaxID=537013 RepID=C0EDM5_9FIRM|nr:hypothetical protein CLOSTMETH_01953 [[Clostridium] methylpentosum DSM 5476]